MPLILNIETATEVCSVCLSEHGKVLVLKESDTSNTHSSILTVFIQDIFKQLHNARKELDAIAISEGPGSYTGLRIGASVAKGLCYSLQKPLLSVSTLRAMAAGVRSKSKIEDKNILYCPMIDARRMEVYTALYDSEMNEIIPPQPKIIGADSFHDILKQNKLFIFGSGSQKCQPILSHPNCLFFEPFHNSAAFLINLSEGLFKNKNFSDLAYYQPVYLKNFIPFKN